MLQVIYDEDKNDVYLWIGPVDKKVDYTLPLTEDGQIDASMFEEEVEEILVMMRPDQPPRVIGMGPEDMFYSAYFEMLSVDPSEYLPVEKANDIFINGVNVKEGWDFTCLQLER